jgi:DNA-binding CsgD family transcriptional regulator
MSGKEFSSRSGRPDDARGAASGEDLYKFEGQPYRLQRLDLSSLRAERGDMSMAGTLRYIRGSGSEPGLHVAVQQAAVALGFDSYTYGCLMQRVDSAPLMYVSTPFSVADLLAYHRAGLLQYDERIRHCGDSIVPGSWTMDELKMASTSPDLVRTLLAKGLASGVFFPIHGAGGETGMLALNSQHPNVVRTLGDRVYDVMAKGHLLAYMFHEQVVRSGMLVETREDDEARREPLNERERDVLIFASKGLESREIGTMLGITERTVNFHFSKILRKLSATNRIEAVAKGVELGLIKPLGLNATTVNADRNASANDEYRKVTGRCYREFPEFPILEFDPAVFGFTEDVSRRDAPEGCPAFATASGRFRLCWNWPNVAEREWYAGMSRFFVVEPDPVSAGQAPDSVRSYVARSAEGAVHFHTESIGELVRHLLVTRYAEEPPILEGRVTAALEKNLFAALRTAGIEVVVDSRDGPVIAGLEGTLSGAELAAIQRYFGAIHAQRSRRAAA